MSDMEFNPEEEARRAIEFAGRSWDDKRPMFPRPPWQGFADDLARLVLCTERIVLLLERMTPSTEEKP